ncbi:MAG: ABC transporter ATP-binding protein [Endomicrobium sp.]|jgi:lipoprotein-releasing system ATP-binding protein|nr:ABC transporter ATP-binding protein [Endomicrobium sp.]
MRIQTINLRKSFRKRADADVEVLKDVSLDIASGRKAAFTGPSGAGKSTLIHILGLMDRPTSGKVLIDGKDCFDLDDGYLCKMRKENIGFMFQFHYLLSDFTVMENILIPVWNNRAAFLERAAEILEKTGLSHRKNHFPSELSGGEQQRAALARALINGPKIIFADEPTGNLDRATGRAIEELLLDSASESSATLILVTHNEELAAKADIRIKMLDGTIVQTEDSKK